MAIRITSLLLLLPLVLVLIRVFPNVLDAPLAFPFLLFCGIGSAVAAARVGSPSGRLGKAGLWLTLFGTASVLALVTIELWYDLVVPKPTVVRDSLPGMGTAILVTGTIATISAGSLVLGWGLWVWSRGRARAAGTS